MVHQYFFQPLLPGFHSHLKIPVAFFLENIEGRYEQKTVKLRSDAFKKIWEVKIDGRRLTDGWKEFALSHDLRMGDIVIFRHERNMAFHVTLLGPSYCEIQYGSCLEDKNNLKEIQRRKKMKKNPRREAESSSLVPSCFVANVSPSSLRYDSLYLPKRFARANGIVTGSGDIVLINENGRSWKLKLKQKQSCGTIYIRGGWTSFCSANRLRAGDIVTFKLSQRGATRTLLRLSPKEPEEEASEVESLSTEPESDEESNLEKIQMKKKPRREIESSSLDPSCFVAYVSPATLRYDRLNLPNTFVKANGLDKRCREIVLMNEKGRSWTLELKGKNSSRVTYIRGGWRNFCHANGIRAGSFFTLKLIQRGKTLALRLCSTKSEEKEMSSEDNEVMSLSTKVESVEESSEDEKSSQECSKRKEMKSVLICKASSSASQNPILRLTLTPSSFSLSRLNLPATFTKLSGIKKAKKICFLDKHGVKWSTNLKIEKYRKRIRLVGGWKEFCEANGVKIGESITLELIWESDKSSVPR